MIHPVRRFVHDILPILWGNWISLIGTTLTTVASNIFLIVLIVDLTSDETNLYAAGIAYLIMPAIFMVGLILIAVGYWFKRRGKIGETVLGKALDLITSDPKSSRRIAFVVVATVINVTVVSLAAYKGVTYSNSPQFCGQMCHSVMQPEYTAYLNSPHARVACAECHIGAGADWFARSKLSGLRQVWATMVGNYSRPIPTPVHNLRPARETCEHCHWPSKFHGTRLIVRHHYQDDEANTRQTNVVQLHVGGVNQQSGEYEGIHWHVSPDVTVRYEALDERRTKVGKIVVSEKGKADRVYLPPKGNDDANKEPSVPMEQRVMDCVDCHNRPSHIYDHSPETAVDKALSYGKIDSTLPFIRKQAVELLRQKDVPRTNVEATFGKQLAAFYEKNHSEIAREKTEAIQRSAAVLAELYRLNVYPALNITWGTYPSHLGHRNTTEGCFRCHNDEHQTASGDFLPQDCDLCHDVIAEEEEEPDVPESMLRLGTM